MDANLVNKTVPVWAIAQLLGKDDLPLPAFQRDAVWDEERVELLWDSLLRGIPIGNLILASSNLPRKACQGSRYDEGMKLTKASAQQDEASSKLVLIDGQQRAAAIRQGITDWKQGLTFRLWVDVDATQEGQKRKEHTVTHAFLLCTRGFPWGTGVSDDQRRQFREKLERTDPDEIKEGNDRKPDYRLSLGYTRPAKAKLPIPFATIARWFIEKLTVEDDSAKNNWPESEKLSDSDIKHRVTNLIEERDSCIVVANIRELWKSDRDKIEKWIIEKQDVIRQALDRKIFFELAFGGIQNIPPDDLGEAFNRINRLGMRLDGADLFFSALKLQCADTHDLVWKVYTDAHAGKLLAPPQIVHAAVRLAIADHNRGLGEKDKISDRPDLSLTDARILLNERSPDNIRPEIDQLIGLGEGKQGNLLNLFRRLRDVLQYKRSTSVSSVEVPGNDGDDFGLSLPLLARLGERKPHIFHNLLLWLHRHPESNVAEEKLRRKMVRYALVDHLFLRVNTNYRRRSFTEVERANIDFPDSRLIELAAEDPDLNLLIQAFKFKHGESNLLLATPDNFATEVKDKEDPADLTDLLLWAQRRYLHDRFPDYDPTLFYNVAALPWDKDHIWPQSKMDRRSVASNEDVREDHDKCKRSHLHSVGNLCLWDRRHNRKVHDNLPGEKYCDTDRKQLAISDDVYSSFCRLTLENGKVTAPFLNQFRKVVDDRRIWLYNQFYETLRLTDLRRGSDSGVAPSP